MRFARSKYNKILDNIDDLNEIADLGLKIGRVAGSFANTARSASGAFKNVNDIFVRRRNVRAREKAEETKSDLARDKVSRTEIMKRQLNQRGKKLELEQKKYELKAQVKKSKSSGDIRVKRHRRKDGTIVKSSTRKRKTTRKR